MSNATEIHEEVFKDYLRPVVHMRRQMALKRFGLIFGAGISKDFHVPDWPELVKRMARDPKIDGECMLKPFYERASLPYRTELLFQHFRQKQPGAKDETIIGSLEFENRTICAWHDIFAKYLYHNEPLNFKKALYKHPYLLKFLPIVQNTPITVTYNFDTYLEYSLEIQKAPTDQTRGFETVTNPWTQFRRSNAVIYHPHGVYPQQLMEMPRDRIVFSDSSYAKQQIGVLSGDMSFLLNHLSKNTSLIIGSSLEDEALKNLLIHSGQSNPGNPHYYIFYKKKGMYIDQKQMRAIRSANFQVYNLITLFLDDNGIAALGDLLNPSVIQDQCIKDLAKRVKQPVKNAFYFTGVLGVGKTSTINQLRSLEVHDEWAEKRLSLLAKPWDQLTVHQRAKVDAWIATQFEIKNEKLRDIPFGIFAIDRSPLDPLAFTPKSSRRKKAKSLLDKISWNGTRTIVDGTVLVLCGNSSELAARLLATGRSKYTALYLDKMDKDINVIYNGSGVRFIHTQGRSIVEIVKQVSEIIHFERYVPFKLAKGLKKFINGSI